MKQNPSRLKYKKNHKPSSSNLFLTEHKNFNSVKGNLILKSLENGKLTYNQIEACRKTIRRILKKQGKVYIRVFTNISITKKPVASRMGKGKGSHHIWICLVKKGQVICEVICYVTDTLNLSLKALKSASSKLPFRTNIFFNLY
jgi:large subunit ribosomal protein L16